MNPFSLENKTIILSGATGGIGLSIAASLAQMGARLVLFGRDESKLKSLIETFPNAGYHLSKTVDFSSIDFADEFQSKFDSLSTPIDGFVHAAGISPTIPLNVLKSEKIATVMQVNVFTAIEISKQLTKKKYIPETGQSIVFISSVMSMVGEPGKTLYSLSKGALLSATKSMALELAPKKIRVNCISPAVVLSPMSLSSEYGKNEVTMKAMELKHPLGFGNPDDVAHACTYLLSNASRWVTGTNLVVDGGYTAR